MTFTTRSAALAVTCPVCSSQPDVACSGRRGPRTSAHAERHAAALSNGAFPLSDLSSRTAKPEIPVSGRTSPTRAARRPRNGKKRARWNDRPFQCPSCRRNFAVATIRSVSVDREQWCDACYRRLLTVRTP